MRKFFDIIFYFPQNIGCGYTLEQPRRGSSNDYPQSIYWNKNKKNRYTPANPRFKGVYFSWTCFPDVCPEMDQNIRGLFHHFLVSVESVVSILCPHRLLNHCMRKQTIWVSDQVRHEPACTDTEAGLKLEISDKISREIILSI